MAITSSLDHGNQMLNSLPTPNEGLHVALAINFYTGLQSDGGKITKENGSALLRHANKLATSQKALQKRQHYGKYIDEINCWIDRAFEFIDPYIGQCVRYDNIPYDKAALYTPGNVVQFNKLSSALIFKVQS
jgi:hypothetical protein